MHVKNVADEPLRFLNGASAPLVAVPVLRFTLFSHWLINEVRGGKRVVAFFALPEEITLRLDVLRMHKTMTEAERDNSQTAAQSNEGVPPTLADPAAQDEQAKRFRLVVVLAADEENCLLVAATDVGDSYPSFTKRVPQMHLFEREIYEQHGIVPQDHPWLKPVRFSNPEGPEIGRMDFFQVEGEDVHEVAVGPIHAGIIEPGHFRFQCLGEHVLHLEVSLGYQHRGIEAKIPTLPVSALLPTMEVIAGDSSIAHGWAYCTVAEALGEVFPSRRGQLMRTLALELERLANHTGDLGALAGDIGFLPTMSFCGRLRGDWLNTTALICGSRFGRGLLTIGGVAYEADADLLRIIRARLKATAKDVHGAVELLWDSPSVMARMTGIGKLDKADALSLGLVGVAAKACGLPRDVRVSHPLRHVLPPAAVHTISWCDVRARLAVRAKEVIDSIALCNTVVDALEQQLAEATVARQFIAEYEAQKIEAAAQAVNLAASEEISATGPVDAYTDGIPAPSTVESEPVEVLEEDTILSAEAQAYVEAKRCIADAASTSVPHAPALFQPDAISIALVEGWRGEVCHVGISNEKGGIGTYKIVDPSFHNWMGLAVAMREEDVSDFPMCNKSFNLSYCGHDL